MTHDLRKALGKDLNEILERFLNCHDGDQPHYADVLRDWLWDNKAGIASSLNSTPPADPPSVERDWKTIEEQIATAQRADLLFLLRDYLVMNLNSGDDLAPLYIARIGALDRAGDA